MTGTPVTATGRPVRDEGAVSAMDVWDLSCKLLFRLRISDRDYTLPVADGRTVILTISTVLREEFDPRIGSGKNVEFLVDRYGWSSYSQVSGSLEAETREEATRVFLGALNYLISQSRDLFEVPWIHEVEMDDLFDFTVGTGGAFQTSIGYGRTRGVGTAMIGLSETGEARLAERLGVYEPVAPWRVLELDATEALDGGRYEEAVILAWSALESGCRWALPNLAAERGITPPDLYRTLTGNNRAIEPWSFEEAVNRPPRAPSVLSIIRETANLQGTAYAPGAIAASAERGYRLRNRVMHNGARLSRAGAREAVDSIRWTLLQLSLPHILKARDADLSNWMAVFGAMSLPLGELLDVKSDRLTLLHSPDRGIGVPVSIERVGSEVLVGLPTGLTETEAAVLTVAMYGSMYRPSRTAPRFFVPSRDTPLVHGLLVEEARALNAMMYQFAHLRRVQREHDISQGIRRAIAYYESPVPDLVVDMNDVRKATIPAHAAAFLALGDEADRARCLAALGAWDQEIADRARRWGDALRAADLHDPHSLCAVARGVHAELWLLDSIHLDCSVERVITGSRRVSYEDYKGRAS